MALTCCVQRDNYGPSLNQIRCGREKISILYDMKLTQLLIFVLVNEMLQCAQKCAGRNSAKYLTFAEFCIFATELKRSLHYRYVSIFSSYLSINFVVKSSHPRISVSWRHFFFEPVFSSCLIQNNVVRMGNDEEKLILLTFAFSFNYVQFLWAANQGGEYFGHP